MIALRGVGRRPQHEDRFGRRGADDLDAVDHLIVDDDVEDGIPSAALACLLHDRTPTADDLYEGVVQGTRQQGSSQPPLWKHGRMGAGVPR